MVATGQAGPQDHRVLVQLRPSTPLAAAEVRANLRPLFDQPVSAGGLGVAATPQWYVADVPAEAANPWDDAHRRVGDRLGVAEDDVLFAEPDQVHGRAFPADDEARGGDDCAADPQDRDHGKAVGDGFAWHLGDGYTQLGSARDEVDFTTPRTRIAHLDTGFGDHETKPERLLRELGRSFVEADEFQTTAADPDNDVFLLDNSGHGTGTVGILAGGRVASQGGTYLGGAPHAEVVPVRIADRVALLRTSTLAQGLEHAIQQSCDVVSLSMGGLPSKLWAEWVDRAYEHGVTLCAAAGNHFGPTPPRVVIYPARFPRVIAVTGVMADRRPYADLEGIVMEGSFGPASAMTKAIAAYTPNIPWPRFGCEADVIRLDGEGTSAATPQVAAAAALWLEAHKDQLPHNWRRVEAVRHALFSTATKTDPKHFGNGTLRARDALAVRPRLDLEASDTSKVSFSLFRVITGLGLAEPRPAEEMFNLELAQRLLLNPRLAELLPDPQRTRGLEGERLRQFMDAVIEDEGASYALRKHVAARYPVATGRSARPTKGVVAEVVRATDAVPSLPDPPYRRLRVYAVDPSFSTRLDTAGIDETTLHVRWERLSTTTAPAAHLGNGGAPGGKRKAGRREPSAFGEYFAFDDVDAKKERYDVVDLDDPRLLAQDGWAPSEGNPQFHQQMVYAVAMSTVERFERALGRPVFWRGNTDGSFRRRLSLQPHALRQANAFYDPERVALLFGYFDADADDPGEHRPGDRVYSCLSYDIVVHETTHAILDGMQRHFNEPTNPDVLALHEAFADLVALLSHFALSDVLEHEVKRTRGDLETESTLGSLAIQFGRAGGSRAALREAIGHLEDGVWQRNRPDPSQYTAATTPHARGAVLVAAVFDAFLAIYRTRTADLLRLSSGGSGLLAAGAIHPDLVHRLCEEAAKSARHVLTMIIRALDYLPPVDVTFFEFLRAIITADFDLVPDDRLNYRVALIDAFRRRGIYPVSETGEPSPANPRTLSVDTLRWRAPDARRHAKHWSVIEEHYRQVAAMLKPYADECLYLHDREERFRRKTACVEQLKGLVADTLKKSPAFAEELGLDPAEDFEVDELRNAMRVGPDGRHIPQVLVSLTQSVTLGQGRAAFAFPGGCSLIFDLTVPAITYCVGKGVANQARRDSTTAFVEKSRADPLHALFFRPDPRRPFAALHQLSDAL